jgi:hypothetical protein
MKALYSSETLADYAFQLTVLQSERMFQLQMFVRPYADFTANFLLVPSYPSMIMFRELERTGQEPATRCFKIPSDHSPARSE